MKPGKADLPTLWRGLDYPAVTFKWKDANGDPFDLTGWTPYAQSTNINLQPVITDYTGGITTIGLTATQTSDVKLGTEQWDWIWVGPDGFDYPPILSGLLPIREATSRIILPPT
jgi:hypothetical protein